jgi:hypothetical protein
MKSTFAIIMLNVLSLGLLIVQIIGLNYLTDQNFRGKKTEDFTDQEKTFMKITIVLNWIKIGLALLLMLFSVLLFFKIIKSSKKLSLKTM